MASKTKDELAAEIKAVRLKTIRELIDVVVAKIKQRCPDNPFREAAIGHLENAYTFAAIAIDYHDVEPTETVETHTVK